MTYDAYMMYDWFQVVMINVQGRSGNAKIARGSLPLYIRSICRRSKNRYTKLLFFDLRYILVKIFSARADPLEGNIRPKKEVSQ